MDLDPYLYVVSPLGSYSDQLSRSCFPMFYLLTKVV